MAFGLLLIALKDAPVLALIKKLMTDEPQTDYLLFKHQTSKIRLLIYGSYKENVESRI